MTRGEEESGDKEQEKAAPEDQSGEEKREVQSPLNSSSQKSKSRSTEKKEQGEKGDEQKVSAAFSESPENILREEKENRLQLYRAPQGGIKPVEKDW